MSQTIGRHGPKFVSVVLCDLSSLNYPLAFSISCSRLWLFSRSKLSAVHKANGSTAAKVSDNVETLGQLSAYVPHNGIVPGKNGYVHGGKNVDMTADHIPRMNGFTHCNGIQPELLKLQPHVQCEHELGVTIIKVLNFIL